MTDHIVSSITENAVIKQILFPPTGTNASTAKGGGAKKTTAQWDLAIAVFQDHDKYGPYIQQDMQLQPLPRRSGLL
jgi:hypothetical protein